MSEDVGSKAIDAGSGLLSKAYNGVKAVSPFVIGIVAIGVVANPALLGPVLGAGGAGAEQLAQSVGWVAEKIGVGAEAAVGMGGTEVVATGGKAAFDPGAFIPG